MGREQYNKHRIYQHVPTYGVALPRWVAQCNHYTVPEPIKNRAVVVNPQPCGNLHAASSWRYVFKWLESHLWITHGVEL